MAGPPPPVRPVAPGVRDRRPVGVVGGRGPLCWANLTQDLALLLGTPGMPVADPLPWAGLFLGLVMEAPGSLGALGCLGGLGVPVAGPFPGVRGRRREGQGLHLRGVQGTGEVKEGPG